MSTGALEDNGFLRSMLGGQGSSLSDAFVNLRSSPRVSWRAEFPDRGLFGARVVLDRFEGEGWLDFLEIRDSVYVVVENATFAERRTEFVPGDGLLSFHVRLAGEFTLSLGQGALLQILGPSLLVWFQPNGHDASEWLTPGRPEKTVTVYCAPDFIRSGLMADGIAVPKHIQTFLDPAADSIRFCQLPVTSEIMEVVENLIGGHGEGRLKLIHMEAKALELFCLILTAFDRLSEAFEEQFSGDDLRRIRKAREILATRFQPVPTIRKLARELGINESKLKRGFKTLFGKTIFEFGHESRMQHAMRLLRDQHVRIGLVAEAVGYTHQTTFASAFKKHFGYRPKEIRRLPVPAPNGPPQGQS